MPFNGSGVFSSPPSPGAFNPALSGQLATPADWNTLLADIENALSLTICRDGQSSVIGNINMGTHRITNLGAPTADSDAARQADVTGVTPAGVIWTYAGATAPTGWFLCDGALKGRTTEAALFTAIGTTYGAGDGSTTFALPDCRGRIIAMLDGGTGRLAGFTALGAAGGQQNQAFAVSVSSISVSGGISGSASGSMGGSITSGTASAGGSAGGANYAYQGNPVSVSGTLGVSGSFSGGGTGSGATDTRTIVQPTIAMNYIIKR